MSYDVKHLEATTGGAKDTTNIIDAIRRIGKDDSNADTPATVSAADLSTPFVVSSEEEDKLVASLRDVALATSNPAVAHADHFWLLAAIRARKGDVARALALAKNYIQWRSSIRSDELNAAKSEKMRAQLRRRIIFVAGNTDRDGRPVLNLRLRNQDPSTFAAIDTTRMMSFVLEWTMRTYPAAQTHGVVIVNDLSNVGFKNLDVRLPGVIQKAFSKTIPVRLASINAVNPPLFLRALLVLLQNILSHKLKARIRVFVKGDEERLAELFAPDQIADDMDMGGSYEWSDEQHEAWIERMISDCQTWGPVTTYQEVDPKAGSS